MKRIREQIGKLNLSFRKEMLSLGVLNVSILAFVIFIFFVRGRPIVFLYGVASLFGVSFFFLSRYGSMVKKVEAKKEDEFVHLFTFFGIYIRNGYNVYQGLKAVSGFASASLKSDFETLLLSIDADKSVTPYVVFARNFNNLEIKGLLLSVFQMVDEGGGDAYLRQFETLFGRLSSERYKLQKESRLSSLSFLTFLPLAGSALAMVSLTAAIAEIMGSYYNVI